MGTTVTVRLPPGRVGPLPQPQPAAPQSGAAAPVTDRQPPQQRRRGTA